MNEVNILSQNQYNKLVGSILIFLLKKLKDNKDIIRRNKFLGLLENLMIEDNITIDTISNNPAPILGK